MSNVRLSNGSPTLERMDGRLADHKPSACRTLFGLPDREELKRELKGQLKGMEEASCARWGFDFANHRPLPGSGRFEWLPVDAKDVPDFYNRPPRAPKGICASGNTNLDLNGNHQCGGTPCPEGKLGDRLSDEQTEKSESQVDSRAQSTAQRKRSATHGRTSIN
ncbi:CDN1B inhibitor, partial [Amia calva]|nr:CDN1B inhibitor [Amia calva]